MKKKMVIIIIILILIISGECLFIVKNNIYAPKNNDKVDNQNNNVLEKNIQDYKKTINYANYVDNGYNTNNENITKTNEINNNQELMISYKIILNNKENILSIRYYIKEDFVYCSYIYNSKELYNDKILEYNFDNNKIDLKSVLKSENLIIEPYHFTTLKGEDGVEYLILEKRLFEYLGPIYTMTIYNDDFEILTYELNNKEYDYVYILSGAFVYNLNQYDYEIGYRTKKEYVENYEFVYASIQDNTIYFIDTLNSNENIYTSHIDTINEYALTIKNNQINIKKINNYEVLYIGDWTE